MLPCVWHVMYVYLFPSHQLSELVLLLSCPVLAERSEKKNELSSFTFRTGFETSLRQDCGRKERE